MSMCGLICSASMAIHMICHQAIPENAQLAEPGKWLSITHVGITQIETHPDGIAVQYRGTVAYKNSLYFSRLKFELNDDNDSQDGQVLLFQFNKERRDSSIHDHHLNAMHKYNRGYGLLFFSDGTAAIVKTVGETDIQELLKINEKTDYACPKKIEIRQSEKDGRLMIQVSIEGLQKEYQTQDVLEKGYEAKGFIGLTLYGGRSRAALSNIAFDGIETKSDLKNPPRPVYLANFFEEPNRRLVHWRYDEWTSNFYAVQVENQEGNLLDIIRYPKRFWIVPDGLKETAIQLRTVDIDGNRSEPTRVQFTDERAAYQTNAPQPRVKIRTQSDHAIFYCDKPETPFSIKGFNYVRLRYGDHALFEAETPAGPAYYDPYDAESTLMRLKKDGYNTVRVFLSGRRIENPGLSGFYENEGLYAPYMDNFIDFLRRAQHYHIYVWPALCDGEIPRNKTYWRLLEGALDGLTLDQVTITSHNAIYLTPQGHQVRAKYAADVVGYVKEKSPALLNTILGLQCQNELSISAEMWPFNKDTGQVKGTDGRLYDMGDNTQRHQLFENSLVTYHKTMAEAIKSVDPEMLVSEGVFTPRIVGKDYNGDSFGVRVGKNTDMRFPPQASVIAGGAIDFVDIHIYYVKKDFDLAESYRLDMISTGLYDPKMKIILPQKPFVLGEFGAFKFIANTAAQARQDMLQTRDLALKDRAQGYLLWTFDTTEQKCLWNATGLGDDFIRDLGAMDSIVK